MQCDQWSFGVLVCTCTWRSTSAMRWKSGSSNQLNFWCDIGPSSVFNIGQLKFLINPFNCPCVHMYISVFSQNLPSRLNNISPSLVPFLDEWDSKCLALIAQMARAFGINPKVGGSSPPQVEIFSVSKTLIVPQEHPPVCREWMMNAVAYAQLTFQMLT